MGLLQDLKTAAWLFQLKISEHVLKDELLLRLSHFSVARTVEAMPEQAVLRFRTWCGLGVQAAALDGMDLQTGEVDANRITKAACGRDAGWFAAHGLIYVTPKHCVCWPMLRGYAALAPERPGGNPALRPLHEIHPTHLSLKI